MLFKVVWICLGVVLVFYEIVIMCMIDVGVVVDWVDVVVVVNVSSLVVRRVIRNFFMSFDVGYVLFVVGFW